MILGNQGGLFMNAMTWWDHKTESVWSQPWGRAIAGPLQGAELELIPSQLVPWATWREAHPDTLALDTAGLSVFGGGHARAQPHDRFVIGVTLGDAATAVPYDIAADRIIINDRVGDNPVVFHVDPERREVHVYLRKVGERVLTFELVNGEVRDPQTGTLWQMGRGLAQAG